MSTTPVTSREELQKVIAKMAFLKRFFICTVLKRSLHRQARAYSIVTVDLLNKNHPLTNEMWATSDRLWAKLYNIDYVPTE